MPRRISDETAAAIHLLRDAGYSNNRTAEILGLNRKTTSRYYIGSRFEADKDDRTYQQDYIAIAAAKRRRNSND